MPDPFRHYEGVPVLDLPADPAATEMPALDVLLGTLGTTPVGDGPTLHSQLLFYSAKQFVRIVDQQVEVGEEIFTEDPTNARIGCLNLSEALDYGSGLFDNVGGCFQRVQNG
jgi:hypothetical protein